VALSLPLRSSGRLPRAIKSSAHEASSGERTHANTIEWRSNAATIDARCCSEAAHFTGVLQADAYAGFDRLYEIHVTLASPIAAEYSPDGYSVTARRWDTLCILLRTALPGGINIKPTMVPKACGASLD
jgi:hypothetical protein